MSTVQRRQRVVRHFLWTVVVAVLVSVGLFLYGAHRSQSYKSSYLLWNLGLAVLPLVFAARLSHVLRFKRWSAWEPIAWSLLWLLFLPNSFYMISDFIHLRDVSEANILYDAVMFTAFICAGVTFGFGSLYLVHHELRRRLRAIPAAGAIAVTLFICSFAIYIGRDLRWNSWDVIANPAGLLFDVSDRLLHPEAYHEMLLTVASFFVLLASLYALVWSAARLLRQLGAIDASHQHLG